LLDNRLEGFQKNIQDSQKSLSDTQLAKIDKSMSDTYKFRKRGNEEQYKHNQKVFIKMKEVNNQIETDNLSQENVNATKRNISEGTRIDHFIDEAIQDSGIDVDSSLYELYPRLCELLISSKSDNTVKSYFNAFKRWEHFITLHGQNALPAQPVHVALYLTSLLKNGSTYHPVYNAVYGIK
jgi:hypothetical protein